MTSMSNPDSPNEQPPIYFCGDTHGDFLAIARWNDMEQGATLIHVGDVGLGFSNVLDNSFQVLSLMFKQRGNTLLAIRGNHDNPAYWQMPLLDIDPAITLVPDGSILDVHGKRILFMGGAISVDRCDRRLGKDYWVTEGFHVNRVPSDLSNLDAVVTHAGGHFTGMSLDTPFMKGWYKREAQLPNSDIRNLRDELEKEREEHTQLHRDVVESNLSPIDKPKIIRWAYGHYHKEYRREIHGKLDMPWSDVTGVKTVFRCLAINQIVPWYAW